MSHLKKGEFTSWALLSVLLLSFIVTPLVEGVGAPTFVLSITLFVTVCVAIWAACEKTSQYIVSAMFAIPVLTANSFVIFDSRMLASIYFLATMGLFLSHFILRFIKNIFTSQAVDTRVLLNATSIYLMLGLLFAMLHGIVAACVPGSYSFIDLPGNREDIFQLVYFSLVTITTLGYGDLAPRSNFAQSLSGVEAVIGQIYLTVIIARLVGLHIAKPKQ